jgi:DNA-binding NarL/FixJ family response regulator
VIADDHQMFREALRRFLDKEPSVEIVGEAANGVEVLRLITEVGADVLLLDLAMPGSSGLDALRSLSELGAPVRTLILTGSTDREEVVQAIRLGARGVVIKDESLDLLIKSIEHVAAGHYWIGHERMGDLLESVGKPMKKPAPRRPVETLTARELQIISAIVQGATNKQIGQQFRLSEQTVKNHLKNIFDKLGVANRLELALFAVNHRLIADGEPPDR